MSAAGARRPWGLIGLVAIVIVSIGLLYCFAPSRRAVAAGGLALAASLPVDVAPGTVLTVGDPVTQWIIEHNGWDRQLPFKLKWVQITGGPNVTEAFHAKALDVGLGANVPPIHAIWSGIPVKIIALRTRRDWQEHPAYVLGVAPKATDIRSFADLRGKRIAFSPSQVQGQVVLETLKAAGLSIGDVKLVELPSSIGGDVYANSLASNVVDVAPLGTGIVAQRYLRKFGPDGARLLPHPDFRDDLVLAYVPVEVLRNPAKAAALRQFALLWGRAQAWAASHQDALARGYYIAHEGLTPADARLILTAAGIPAIPTDWRAATRYQQAAIDMIAPRTGRPRFAAAELFDARFEGLAAQGFADGALPTARQPDHREEAR